MPAVLRATATVVALAAATVAGASAARADAPYLIRVGMPGFTLEGHPGVGALDSFLPLGGGQSLTEVLFGLGDSAQPAGERFGASLAVADLNLDGFDDLIVGVPGTPGLLTTPGHVDLLFGSPTGTVTAGAVSLPSPALEGDEFGAAVAVQNRFDGTDDYDLWVGAPGHDVSGKANAGAVYRYVVSRGTATYLETITQDSPLVPGAAKAGDRFGEVLAPASHGVVVGIPDEDVGAAKDAGAIQRLRTSPVTHALLRATEWSQVTAGVPGTPEAGDRFGAAVSSSGFVVGVPGESVGKVKAAGAIQTFGPAKTLNDSLTPSKAFSQSSPAVPGISESGDHFGAALTTGVFDCPGALSVAVGAPGEDSGTIKDSGAVTLIPLPLFEGLGCPAPKLLSQGNGLPDRPEAGDGFGAALSTAAGDPDSDQVRYDMLVIGVPGEEIGAGPATVDAGRVVTWLRGATRTLGFQGGDMAGLRYGSVLPN